MKMLLIWVTSVSLLSSVLFSPILFGQKLFFDGDALAYNYPAFAFYASEANGGEEKWNPYTLQGTPMALSPVGDHLDPLTALLAHLIEDSYTLVHVRFLISVILGIFFALLFSRATGLSRVASILVASAYLIAQTLSGMSAALVNSGSFFVLPMLLYVTLQIHTRKHLPWPLILGGILLGFAWLSGFIQMVLYSVVIAGAFALHLGFRDRHSDSQGWWRTPFSYSLLVLIGVATALPSLLPTVALRTLTPRVSGFGSEVDGIGILEFFHFVFPDYMTVPFLAMGPSWGLYLGILGLFFAVCGGIHAQRNNYARFFFWTYLVVIIFSVKYLGLSTLVQQLPVFSSFHTLARVLFPGSFALAFLAGYGFDHIASGKEVSPDFKKFIRYFGFFTLVILSCFLLLNLSFLIPLAPDRVTGILDKVFNVLGKNHLDATSPLYVALFIEAWEALQNSFSLAYLRVILPVLSLPAVYFLVSAFANGRMGRKTFHVLAGIFATLSVFIIIWGQSPALISKETYTQVPTLAKLLEERESSPLLYYLVGFYASEANYRALGTLSSDAQVAFTRETLGTNVNLLSRIPKADGYEPFRTNRQAHFWWEIMKEGSIAQEGVSFSDALNAKRERFLSLLPVLSQGNVKYVLSGYPLFHGCLSVVQTPTIPDVRIPLYLYENSCALERVFIPQRVLVTKEWSDDYFNLMSQTSITIVECSDCIDGQTKESVFGGSVILRDIKNGRIDLTVVSDSETWVVIAQSELPGWRATIDGVEAPIYTANYLHQAIRVPSGEHQIVVQYSGITQTSALKKLIGGSWK